MQNSPLRRRLTGDKNQCPTCGAYFNSTRAFDYHRRGPYSDRYCLTEAAMLEAGMCKNAKDFWIRDKNTRQVFAEVAPEPSEIAA